MALVASDLITAARQRTFGAQGRQRISNGQLLAELSFQDAQIMQEISQVAPDLLATVDGFAGALDVENTYGYQLDAAIHYRHFTHVNPTTGVYTPIFMVIRQDQEGGVRHPAGMLSLDDTRGVFYPVDPEGNRWTQSGSRDWYNENEGHQIHYSYIPAPEVLTALDDELGSPEMAREALVCALELAILLANPDAPDRRVASASQRYVGARTNLLFQAHKFGHPVGQRASGRHSHSDADWVAGQVGR